MADSAVPVSGGSGYNVDTRTESINGDHRQVVVLGDPVTGANVVSVDTAGRLYTATGGISVATPSPVAANSTSNSYVVTATNAGNITFWIYNNSTTSGVSSGAIAFEQSPDGNNWAPLPVVRSDTGAAVTALTATSLGANAGIAFDAALEGVNSARMRVTTAAGSANILMYGLAGGLAFEPSVAITGSPTVTAPAITKATQGTTGFTTQDLKDAGRAPTTYNVIAGASNATANTETLLTLQLVRSAANVATATSMTVTSGKTYRIQSITVSMRVAAAAAVAGRISLRHSPSGTSATTSSPVVWTIELSSQGSTANGWTDRFHADFPDGLEFNSTTQFGISQQATVASGATWTVALVGYEY